jgi:hypothetical protein
MIWKEKVTPAGRHVSRLQVLARPISDNASGSWQTPHSGASKGGDYTDPEKAISRWTDRRRNNDLNEQVFLTHWPTPDTAQGGAATAELRAKRTDYTTFRLEEAARLSSWPTPVSQDDNKTPEAHLAMKRRMGERDGTGAERTAITSLQVMVQTVGWPSPVTEDARSSARHGYMLTGHSGTTLLDAARMWVSPSARDWKDTPGMATEGVNPDGSARSRLDQLPRQVGLIQTGSPAGTGKSGQLNPAFSLWLMGYPTAWARCAAQVTRLSRRSRRK